MNSLWRKQSQFELEHFEGHRETETASTMTHTHAEEYILKILSEF